MPVPMVDSFIIDELHRRERRDDDAYQPAVELPLPSPEDAPARRETDAEEKPKRGVVVIDLVVD